jgi:NAD+ kinase
MRIAIHGKEFNRQSAPLILRIFEMLSAEKVELRVSSKFSQYLKSGSFRKFSFTIYDPAEELTETDYLISIGGDGTLLESVTHIGHLEIPVLGINTGRLGFLATIGQDEIEKATTDLLQKNFVLDKRAVLELETNASIFNSLTFALNDFTVVKKDTSSMITIHTYVNGEFLNSYWADGIIVATPTGSTGYSLSCGGPLIFPRSGNFVITPVSPHNLTVRPIVVPDSSELSFRIEGRSKRFLVSLDSRIASVDSSAHLLIRKAPFGVNLIQLPGQHYFRTLRHKLNWGLDFRN